MKTFALSLVFGFGYLCGLYIGSEATKEQLMTEQKRMEALVHRASIEAIILDYELGNIVCEHSVLTHKSGIECHYITEAAL